MSEHSTTGPGDRIERSIEIRAPRRRVWRALADAAGVRRLVRRRPRGRALRCRPAYRGRITHPGYEHLAFTATSNASSPSGCSSFRWHPYAMDPTVDYSGEATTLVVFELEPAADGTRLRVVESGFDALPRGAPAEAFRMNSQGWDAQMDNIRRHVVA